jgi:hypothetical protein
MVWSFRGDRIRRFEDNLGFRTSQAAGSLCEGTIDRWQVYSAPSQRALTHSAFRQVFGEMIDRGPETPRLVTRSRSVWLLHLP